MNLWLPLLLGAVLLLSACGSDEIGSLEEEAYDKGPIEIAGGYIDEWGSDHQVTQTTWSSFAGASVVHILDHSNVQKFLVGRNDAVNSFDPSLYSRHDWMYYGGSLYYCTTAFNKATLAEAYAASVNRANPTTGGCDSVNNFSWTNLTP